MSREAFELNYCGGCHQFTRRNQHGDYVLPSVQEAWLGWQSGQADAYERAAKVCGMTKARGPDDGVLAASVAFECADAIRALAKEAVPDD